MPKLLQIWGDQLGLGSISARDLPPPPQYMLSLYNSVTDNKAPNPYAAKVIRSYTDKGIRKAQTTYVRSG